MAAVASIRPGEADRRSTDFDTIHKLPRGWRYLNISVLWIFYYKQAIRLFYGLRIRHEVATALSILSGLLGAWLIVKGTSLAHLVGAAVLVHFKDVFDATDGALARLTGTGHRFGRFLDTIGDGIVFSVWISAVAIRSVNTGAAELPTVAWAAFTWLSLFLQCSYFNFHQLHYIRLAGTDFTSRFDERAQFASPSGIRLRRATDLLARVYNLWFGWQDRAIAAFDRWQREIVGLTAMATSAENNDWYGDRRFMVANSALCFGTHAFILIVCLLMERPHWFFPAVAVGMNLYFAGIVLARRIVFRRSR